MRIKSLEKEKGIRKSLAGWAKREIVFVIALVCAVVSAFFYPVGREYLEYIDFRTLGLLFCLMTVAGGLKGAGALDWLSGGLLRLVKNTRQLYLILVFLPFFMSMLVTNDVALIAFVPFGILVLEMCGKENLLLYTVVMQTVAANGGSTMTPVGNPQNLLLFSSYQLSAGEFFSITVPAAGLTGGILLLSCLAVKRESLDFLVTQRGQKITSPALLKVYGALFLLCLTAVFRVIPWQALVCALTAVLLIMDGKIFKTVDYWLLATFVCFFIFAGNLGNIPPLRDWLTGILEGREMVVSALASQVISNVPAAVLLSPFTDNYRGMILGTNIGGFGTLIASLASIISFKFYCASKNARPGRYFCVFTAVNLFLLLLFLLIFGIL